MLGTITHNTERARTTSTDYRLGITSTFTFRDIDAEIRPMGWDDLETLRLWKNVHREFFSHRTWIAPDAQQAWYRGFRNDPASTMLVGLAGGTTSACVGFRQATCGTFGIERDLSRTVELFNLMCGNPELAGQGYMTAFTEAIFAQYASQGIESVILCVLRSNTRARNWYEKRGFQPFGSDETCEFLMRSLERSLERSPGRPLGQSPVQS